MPTNHSLVSAEIPAGASAGAGDDFIGLQPALGTLPLLGRGRTRSVSPENPTVEKGKGAMGIPDPPEQETFQNARAADKDRPPVSQDIDPCDRAADRLLARLGLLEDAPPLFGSATAVAWCVPELPPNGAQPKRPHTSIAKLPERITMHRKMHSTYRAAEHPATGMFLERLDPYEGKLSRTVLTGVWAG